MHRLAKWAHGLGLSCGLLSGAAILATALCMTYGVIVRKLGHPSIWVSELSIYATIWAIYIGICYVEGEDAQIRMPLIVDIAPRWLRRLLDHLSFIITVAVLVLLIWFSAKHALKTWTSGQTSLSLLRVPLFYVRAAVPVGGVLALIQVLARHLTKAQIQLPEASSSNDTRP